MRFRLDSGCNPLAGNNTGMTAGVTDEENKDFFDNIKGFLT